ncbi:hypothetical protein PCYB_125550 [Plasmodium cynomolgi strain B]|uniref:ENTH domain-containing protein n=1 Tax=Plasmodium cynomolgi (strain B) TaxID=1120755 RepID=K6UWI7_PLACD|nr:hypothetical protein PCYB_125550 [Plasmodium cynomolgi strain B]GAB67989.1 hypothetical protein PCYB_125550 [Plasmodium cynomolgi strain B]
MNRLILNKATSSNDEPTPGYLYNEISQMAFCSKESMNLVGEYLLKKLQRTDVNVKIKTLKILKHLCDKKRPDFRNFLKKKIDIIKNCQACSIVHDELKGETPSMLVRKEASDLIKLIYSYDAAESDGKCASNNSQDMVKNNRIQGFGNSHFDKSSTANSAMHIGMHSGMNSGMSSSYGVPPGGSGGVGSALDPNASANTNQSNHMANNFNNRNNYMNKMSGFGNPYFNQNPEQKTKGEIAIQYLNEVANKYMPSSFVNKINKVSASLSKNYANGSLNIQSIMNGNAFNKNLERNRVGRSAVSSQGGFSSQSGFSSQGGFSSQSGVSSFAGQGPLGRLHPSGGFQNARRDDQGRKPQESQTAGIYERKIIEDVLINAGINKVPPESLLNEFAQKCETLDTKLIVSILTAKLRLKYINEEENWKNKLKVLCAIKHLLVHRKRKENGQAIETLEILIQNLKDQTLEELYRSKEIKHLKKQVMEIFVLMGLRAKQPGDDSRGREAKPTMQIGASVEIPNLLDIDDDVPMDVTRSNGNSRNTAHGGGTTNTQGAYPPVGNAYESGVQNGKTLESSLDLLSDRKNYPTEGGNQDNMKKVGHVGTVGPVDPVDDLIIHFDHLSVGAPPNLDPPQGRTNSGANGRANGRSGANNSELFSSLQVKYQHKEDTRHTCQSNDISFATTQSIQKGEKKTPLEMSSSARAPTQSSNQINLNVNLNLNDTGVSNLIFLESKNEERGNTKGAISTEKNLPHFNEANDFFSFDNATEGATGGNKNRTTKPQRSNNAYVGNTKYSDQTNNTNMDGSSIYHLSKDKNDTMKNYGSTKEQGKQPFGGNKIVDQKNIPSDDLSLIDMQEDLSSLTSDSHFAGATSRLSCGKGQTQGYTSPYGGGIMNSSSSSNPCEQPPRGNYQMMHTNDPNKSANKFQSHLNSTGNFSSTDDQINNFFNSFAISSKRNEEGNKKPSVQIDAFELLADELKL